MLNLRNYQQRAVDGTADLWARGLRSVLFVCPTGGGKTHVFAELARLNRGRTLVLADRKRLIDQAADRCRAAGLTVGFEQAERRVGDRLPRVVCATIQSIARPDRLRRFKPDTFSLIVVDEADLGIAPSYLSVLEHFAGARVFGCTATPDRADGQSLGAVFEDVAARVEMADLIRAGYLSPLRRHLVRIESVSLEKLRTDDGDFSNLALERILTEERALHEVVRPTMDLASDRSTLIFGATVKHAEELAALLNRYRPGCARTVRGAMNTKEQGEQDAIIAAFERQEFQFLTSCALLLRGVDLPLVSCVAMARPTLSRALYAQAIGRGTRLSPETGKQDLLVLDFADSNATHDLCSPIDAIAPSAPEEVKERARELLDGEQGADPLEVIDRAEAQLETDPTLRERVRARVEFNLRDTAKHGPKRINWKEQPLGKISDVELALRLGVARSAVTTARLRRGIAPPEVRRAGTRARVAPSTDRAPNARKDTDWSEQPLGTVSDCEIARRLGLDQSTVTRARIRRGIASVRPQGPPKSIDWSVQPLGEISDKQLAQRLGVTKKAVHDARKRRGIAPARSPSCRKNIDWDAQPLGESSDEDLARRLGVVRGSVAAQRRKRRIPHASRQPT